MKIINRVICWMLTAFFVVGAFVYIPGVSALLFLIAALLCIPIDKISALRKRLIPPKAVRVILVFALFIAGAMMAPSIAEEEEIVKEPEDETIAEILDETVEETAETEPETEPEIETEAIPETEAETEPETAAQASVYTPTEYTEGQYKIGKDMPAGVYVLVQQDYSWMAYFAITSDANGKDIFKNDNFENSSIVEVVDGEYLEINRCSAFPIEEDPEVGIMQDCLLAGSYIVGKHIAPGEYKAEADPGELAYICIYPDTRRSKIYSNDNFEGSRYVALEEGQLVEIKRGRILIGD